MIFVVPISILKEKILKKSHDSPLASHPGFFKTYRMLREIFAWKGLNSEALKYVNEFPTCQKNKVEHTHPFLSYIPFQFQHKNGRAFPWISSLVCPKYLVRIAYLWWWIESLNFLIYLLLLPLSLLRKWLNYFLKKFSDCMGFLRALSVIEIAYFLVHFGKNSSKWWG